MRNIASRFKTGRHKISRPLDASLDRCLDGYSTRMLMGGSRPQPPNYLLEASRCLNELIRIHKRMAKNDPLFDYAAREDERRRAAARHQSDQEFERALARVYGRDAQQ